MLKTFGEILKDNFGWRKQVARLSVFELVKQSRGAALGWSWFFIKPGMYIFCFWFALEIGMRQGSSDPTAPPYILWLCAGLMPWFFMQDMLNKGSDSLHQYPYLVNKIKFPICCIPTIVSGGTFIIQLMLEAVLFVIYFICGMPLDLYLLQVPLLLFLMFIFWDIAALGLSMLSAMSKDFANLIKTISTPLFWLSGVLFDVASIKNNFIQDCLLLNPVTFFIRSFRDAFVDKVWFWNDTKFVLCFVLVFVITLVISVFVYRATNKEVADAL